MIRRPTTIAVVLLGMLACAGSARAEERRRINFSESASGQVVRAARPDVFDPRPETSGRAARTTGLALLDPDQQRKVVSSASQDPAASSSPSTSTVGMPARIDQLVIPGTELEAKPIEDRREPVVLRVVDAFPHGSAFRYDLVYYALEPGDYDLRNYLRRKDGSALGEIPPIPVRVAATIAPGQIQPHALQLDPSPRLGGYRFLIALGASIWLAGLTYILMRGRRAAAARRVEAARPVTLGDRLRPLVGAALDGTLDDPGRAELERLLIGYWRDRLGLQGERPAAALAAMREHPEAGPLLRGLEDWLHRPESSRKASGEDLAALLRPYLDAPAEPARGFEGEPAQAVAGRTP